MSFVMEKKRKPDVVVRPPAGKSWGQMTEEEIQALVSGAAARMKEVLDKDRPAKD